MAEKSGIFWIGWANENAPKSDNIEDLAEPFRKNATAFVKALRDAGATVEINTTRRSDKRAYLFHWAWKIGLGKVHASTATGKTGVDIIWDHGSKAKSKAGAREMIDGFGLAVPPQSTVAPSLTSKHIRGEAIDMDIDWSGTLRVKRKNGTIAEVPFDDDVNANTLLHKVGESYGVKKLKSDAPHWSDTGH
jgi:hypothetical protein